MFICDKQNEYRHKRFVTSYMLYMWDLFCPTHLNSRKNGSSTGQGWDGE